MAKIRNLEAPGSKSFVSFSNPRISSNLDKAGISLGGDDNIVIASTVAIKNIELGRLAVAAKNKKQLRDNNKSHKSTPNITDYSDEEREERLSGEINEESQE
jgi:uncharacterized protein YabE (DUF348 family)